MKIEAINTSSIMGIFKLNDTCFSLSGNLATQIENLLTTYNQFNPSAKPVSERQPVKAAFCA